MYVSYIDTTTQQQKDWAKIIKKWQGTYGTIVTQPHRVVSREEVLALKDRSWMKALAAMWKAFDAPTKLLWKTYGAYSSTTGYGLFMQEYCYRRKFGLSLPPETHQLYQMYGMLISNPDGSGLVQAQRYDIAVEGEITVSVNFKKIEREVTAGEPFTIHAIAYYFEQGENKSDETTIQIAAGNLDWQNEEFTFGTSGRYYFELIVSFILDHYNADVVLDNFVVSDDIGTVVSEPWKVKAGKTWQYQIRTRKQGWEFSPAVGYPYIEIAYTGE